MASLCILAFDHEGRPIQFDTWLDDLQLYLLSDSRDSVSLFDLESGTSPAPPATADSATCSQWLTHDAAARLAIRNHLPLQPASPLPAPSPYTEQSGSLTERREPASRLVSPVRTARRVLLLSPARTLWHFSDRASATSPTVSRLLATAVTDPSLKSAAASALVAELLDFAAACCLDYATALVAESASASPPSIGGECALGMDVLEDRQEEFECLAAAVPRFASMLHAPEGDPDAPDIPTPCSFAEAITGTYIDEVPPPGVNIVNGMWIFKVKRPPGSPPAFKARYVARCFSQRQGVDYFQAFSPTPKMTTLRVLLHVAAQRDYELHSLDFSTAFLYGSLHEEIWLRRPPGFIWSTTLAALGFVPSTADPSMFLRTDTLMPPFYVLVYVDDLVFATADTEALTLVKSELQKRHTCSDLVTDLITHIRTSYARYHAALPTEFCAKNPPPTYITLYYLVTRLPDSLASVRDHFLSLCPTELTVDLLEERLTAAEKSILAVAASRGDPRAPFFEGFSPVPLLPSVASAAAINLVGTKEVGAASAPSGRRHNSKGKRVKGGGGDGGGGGGGGGGGIKSGGGGGGGGPIDPLWQLPELAIYFDAAASLSSIKLSTNRPQPIPTEDEVIN
ncbi:unnamed protein product, partial [Closterium sp. NIES-53]